MFSWNYSYNEDSCKPDNLYPENQWITKRLKNKVYKNYKLVVLLKYVFFIGKNM